PGPSFLRSAEISCVRPSRMLRSSLDRDRRSSAVAPMPNIRSKTKRGLVSDGSGSVGFFHDIEFMYAHAYPWSHAPTTSLRSIDTSSDGSFVSRQIFPAIT